MTPERLEQLVCEAASGSEAIPPLRRTIVPKLAEELAAMGGRLECKRCTSVQPLGDIGAKLRGGWPRCCGQTMTWVTARQLAERKP